MHRNDFCAEDDRPKSCSALRAWLAELESSQRMLEQQDRLVRMLERAVQRRRSAAVAAMPGPTSAPEESDAVVLALIPRGALAERRVTVKTWRGRRVFDAPVLGAERGPGQVRAHAQRRHRGRHHAPALVDALSLALRVPTADGTAKGSDRA